MESTNIPRGGGGEMVNVRSFSHQQLKRFRPTQNTQETVVTGTMEML